MKILVIVSFTITDGYGVIEFLRLCQCQHGSLAIVFVVLLSVVVVEKSSGINILALKLLVGHSKSMEVMI